jgi:hypothetical protein
MNSAMSSSNKFHHAGLSKLEQDVLIALNTNDVNSISDLHPRLDQFTRQLETAVLTDSIGKDEARAQLYISHNVFIALSQAEQAQLAMDELSAKLTQKLNLLAPLAPSPPAPSPPPSKQSLAEDASSSSTSHTILKNWSQA